MRLSNKRLDPTDAPAGVRREIELHTMDMMTSSNGNNREANDLRRQRAHYDVILMDAGPLFTKATPFFGYSNPHY